MESLKPFQEIHQPDQRNLMFVRMDTGKPITLEEHHGHVASIKLNSAVPEDVRSYFATIQNVCLYSWFAYDLYAIVQFLCLTCSEMALRMRLPAPGRDRRSLTELVKAAAKKKLIKAKGFSHIRQMRQAAAERLRMERHMLKQSGAWPKLPKSTAPKTDYADVLAKSIPWLRNSFAHPRYHAIIVPGQATFQLQLTAEFINQLFAP